MAKAAKRKPKPKRKPQAKAKAKAKARKPEPRVTADSVDADEVVAAHAEAAEAVMDLLITLFAPPGSSRESGRAVLVSKVGAEIVAALERYGRDGSDTSGRVI